MDMKEEYSARFSRASTDVRNQPDEADPNTSSWQAVVKQWKRYVDRAASKVITFFGVAWVAAFARRGAIPAAKR